MVWCYDAHRHAQEATGHCDVAHLGSHGAKTSCSRMFWGHHGTNHALYGEKCHLDKVARRP